MRYARKPQECANFIEVHGRSNAGSGPRLRVVCPPPAVWRPRGAAVVSSAALTGSNDIKRVFSTWS
jgi:hypothetical protein